MGLVDAPVYVLDVKKIGFVHLKLIINSLQLSRVHFNLVLINNRFLVPRQINNINIVLLKSINYHKMCLLNQININKCISLKSEDESVYKESKFVNCGDLNFFVRLKRGEYKFVLPQQTFGYIIERHTVLNAFGDKFIEFNSNVDFKVIRNCLYLKALKETEVKLRIYYDDEIKENLELLYFDIVDCECESKIKDLKNRALEEFLLNPFNVLEVKSFKIGSIEQFFRLIKLRKQYLNDYLFLLKNFFGMRLVKGILKANPNELIKSDFCIKYKLYGQEFKVCYSNSKTDKVKLSYVGHKLGSKDNFVYSF